MPTAAESTKADVSLLDFNELFDAAGQALDVLWPGHKQGDEGCGCDRCDAYYRLKAAWEQIA